MLRNDLINFLLLLFKNVSCKLSNAPLAMYFFPFTSSEILIWEYLGNIYIYIYTHTHTHIYKYIYTYCIKKILN